MVALTFPNYSSRRFWVLPPRKGLALDLSFLCFHSTIFSSAQSLSRVQLFATPWIVARQASLSVTNSRSSLRLMSIESVMPSSHLTQRGRTSRSWQDSGRGSLQGSEPWALLPGSFLRGPRRGILLVIFWKSQTFLFLVSCVLFEKMTPGYCEE